MLRLPAKWAVPGAIAAALIVWFAIDAAIVSDEEQVEQILDSIVAAARKADAQGMTAAVSPAYNHLGMNKRAIDELAQAYTQCYGQTKITILRREIVVANRLATAELAVSARAPSGPGHGAAAVSKWQISFQKKGDRWDITKISPVELERQPIQGWGAIVNLLGLGKME